MGSRIFRPFVLAVLLTVAVPYAAHAAVFINEIAWMGTSASANAEWMELYNTGATTVDISGFVLAADDGAPSITFPSGKTIGAAGYFLLERTSDDSVPSITADYIYAGALGNGGETLYLKNASGAVVDTVTGGTNWVNVGGDNTTKETAQRTASGWVTAPGTPRAANPSPIPAESAGATSVSGGTNATTASSTVTASAGPMVVFVPPELIVSAGDDRTLSVNAGTPFTAVVYDDAGHRYDDALVVWSFGDGMRRTGRSVMHEYYEPGEYVATAYAEANGTSGEDIFIVTVRAAAIRISALSEKGITLMNTENRMIDLSRWRIRESNAEFIIPERTAILPGRSVTFSRKVTELTFVGSVELRYPNGDVAASYPSPAPIVAAQPPPSQAGSQKVSAKVPIEVGNEISNEGVIAPAALGLSAAAAGATISSSSSQTTTEHRSLFSSVWTLSFIGLVLASGAALLIL